MSIATQELLDVVAELATIREMKVALNVTAQCGLMAAVSTMIGGLIAGPPGIAVGKFSYNFFFFFCMAKYFGKRKYETITIIFLQVVC